VFYNIISNAKKFLPEKGKIIFRVYEKERYILFEIADNGPGIPNELKKSIFEKFRTNHMGRSEGMGLGLYICKKIIELHKGKIWIQDSQGGGATFCIQLKKM
jgi:two-component system, OmpR family, sensor histidine kinase KdpD